MTGAYEQLLKQGDNFANQGKFDEALDQYVQARNADPSRLEARKQIINMAIKKEDFEKTFLEYLDWSGFLQSQGKFDEGLKVLQEALSLESQYEKRGFLRDKRSGASAKLKEKFSQLAGQFYERLGEIYNDKKEYNNAVEYLLKAVDIAPASTKAHCLLGVAYLSKGLLDKAKGPFQEVVRFQGPETALAYEKLAEIYSSQGNTGQMVIWLKDAADAYIRKSEWEKATRALENIIRSEPQNKEILTRLGDIYAKQGRSSDAVRVYKQLAEIYSQAGSFDKVIVLYEKLVEWEPEDETIVSRAIEIYRTALKVDPGNLRARIKLIENLLRKGAVDEVIGEYLQLVDDYLRMGLQDEAVHCCEKILEFEPNHAKAREKLANLYLKIGRSEEAGKQFITLVETLRSQGEENRSSELIQKAMGLVREKSEVHLALAHDFLKKGMAQEALAEFEKVLSEQPDHPETLWQVGRLFMEEKKWDAAEKRLLRLSQLNPQQKEVKEKLLEIYETQLLREMEEFSLLPG